VIIQVPDSRFFVLFVKSTIGKKNLMDKASTVTSSTAKAAAEEVIAVKVKETLSENNSTPETNKQQEVVS
jgi:hypothetical protein